METCGPITLFVYNRCIELSTKYDEMKELRSLFLAAATCSSEYRRSKLMKLRGVQMSASGRDGAILRSG